MTRRDAYWILNALPGIGPITLNRLLDAFDGDPALALRAGRSTLCGIEGLTRKAVDSIVNHSACFDLSREKRETARLEVDFVCREDERYPSLLKEIHDPPIGFYASSDYAFSRPCVAMVGSRRTTLYGQGVAREMAQELARRGICVVSGMARGVDTCAHKGALDAEDGRTVAVLGCGIDIVYPPENIRLYREIGSRGAVISEFPLGRKADRQTFPMRNRLVSGMSLAVVVVESDTSGGSMITARFAGEQGRLVCAVPGRIDQQSSRGCNQLIRDGAMLLSSVDDLLSELEYESGVPQLNLGYEGERQSDICDLSEGESQTLKLFAGGEVLGADRLSLSTRQSAAEMSSTLMMLELKGYIAKRLDGSYEAVSQYR